MDKEKIERINFLAKKSKTQGLTSKEKEEQEALRNEYRSNIRKNLINQLNNVHFADESID